MRRALSIVFAGILLCTGAVAQSGEDRALALRLFEEGRALQVAGRYEEAAKKFEDAATKMRTFGILYNLAECQEKLGKTASAWSIWREARSVASTANNAEDEALAAEREKGLAPRLSHLSVNVPVDSERDGLAVTRDGASIPQTAWGTAGAIDPGRHTIEARAPGYRQWSTTVLIGAENDDRVVTVPALEQELSPLPPAAPTPSLVPVGPSAAPSAKNEHADEPTSTHRIIGGSVVGAGAVAVIVGLVEYLNGRSKIDQAVSTATSGIERNDRALYSTAQPMLEEGVTHRDLGGVLLGVGSAAIAAGVVVLLIAPSQAPADTPARVAVWTGARAGGLRWTATW